MRVLLHIQYTHAQTSNDDRCPEICDAGQTPVTAKKSVSTFQPFLLAQWRSSARIIYYCMASHVKRRSRFLHVKPRIQAYRRPQPRGTLSLLYPVCFGAACVRVWVCVSSTPTARSISSNQCRVDSTASWKAIAGFFPGMTVLGTLIPLVVSAVAATYASDSIWRSLDSLGMRSSTVLTGGWCLERSDGAFRHSVTLLGH